MLQPASTSLRRRTPGGSQTRQRLEVELPTLLWRCGWIETFARSPSSRQTQFWSGFYLILEKPRYGHDLELADLIAEAGAWAEDLGPLD